ncbi:MAG: bifunctional DNA-binding transcriptional regulator/O6-methylguanine-DNA methyltransferase Ada [Proteobacteria bacterium]|nr:bifunctional DNA-binding transcriptional regulator/O6-methylguanine-DNA methyltransferase Ada [Pseudomonadota bacterium]
MQALNIPRAVPAPRFDDDEARWAAVQARDARADDVFFYSVRTTGVYCRPSCAARPARRENVAFHATQAAAVAAGFRACKRCQPDQAPRAARHAALVAEACRLIESAEQPPDLNSLADSAGLSPFHFHRVFKRIVGVTPKAYADARRAARVRDGLEAGDSVTRVAYDAGFNSNGRFYDHVPRALGMQPTRFRAGGAGETIRFAVGQCALGAILVAATARGICTIELGDDPAALLRDFEARFKAATLKGGDAEFEQWVARVVGFVEQPALGLDLPLDVRGTAFQARVWQALCAIPPGRTASYAEVASSIGAPRAMRAVAQACAANPVAVAIPCHRVIRNDGALSGYRWGVERKRALLASEVRGEH